jgi:hypothetical protein
MEEAKNLNIYPLPPFKISGLSFPLHDHSASLLSNYGNSE